MLDSSDQPIETFVVEPVTQLDGSPVSTLAHARVAGVQQKLERPGIIALAEGLALAVCFFLPWLAFPNAVGTVGGPGILLKTVQYSGLDTAIGIPEGPGFRVALFAHLWLIPITAIALLVVAWFCLQRRLAARAALGCVLALSVLALLISAGFYWQIASITAGSNTSDVAVVWGCWLAMSINVVAAAACVYLLRPALFSFQRNRPTEALDG